MGTFDPRHPITLSKPVPFLWAGWQANSVELQRNGWEIAVSMDQSLFAYTFLLKHPALKLYAITEPEAMSFFDYAPSHANLPPITINRAAANLDFRVIQQSWTQPNFKVIDAEPMYIESFDQYQQSFSADQLNLFNTRVAPKEEVIVDKADMTVIEHLEAIKQLQAPKQDEIRERMRNEEFYERVKPEATNIISLPLRA